jgi:hypothetical protein
MCQFPAGDLSLQFWLLCHHLSAAVRISMIQLSCDQVDWQVELAQDMLLSGWGPFASDLAAVSSSLCSNQYKHQMIN